jgi:hypothetical protein
VVSIMWAICYLLLVASRCCDGLNVAQKMPVESPAPNYFRATVNLSDER